MLRSRSGGQRGRFDTCSRQSAFKFLPPMCNISSRSVTINHDHRLGTCVRELMENPGRYVDGLSCSEVGSFGSEAHFAGALDNEINFFLFLVVPRHLSAIW